MNKIHFAIRYYPNDIGMAAWWPACGTYPILKHEGERKTAEREKVTCKSCQKTKLFKTQPPLVKIKNPPKMWSPCWYEEGEDYCPICDKGKEH